jgi:aminoglycoside 6'-N-acetyltransferase I
MITALREPTAAWLRLRQALWPDTSAAEHREEMAGQCRDPDRYAQFLATESGVAVGFAEAAIRSDYVPGTDTSPVAFLEGLYVEPGHRRQGIARRLVAAVELWAAGRGLSELASDTPLENGAGQRTHLALGFVESERVVFYSKRLARELAQPGESAAPQRDGGPRAG